LDKTWLLYINDVCFANDKMVLFMIKY